MRYGGGGGGEAVVEETGTGAGPEIVLETGGEGVAGALPQTEPAAETPLGVGGGQAGGTGTGAGAGEGAETGPAANSGAGEEAKGRTLGPEIVRSTGLTVAGWSSTLKAPPKPPKEVAAATMGAGTEEGAAAKKGSAKGTKGCGGKESSQFPQYHGAGSFS